MTEPPRAPSGNVEAMLADLQRQVDQLPEFEHQIFRMHRNLPTVPSMLYHWLRHDTWTRNEGLALLVGLVPPGSFYESGFCSMHDGTVPTALPPKTARLVSARYLDGSLVCLAGFVIARGIVDRFHESGELPRRDDEVPHPHAGQVFDLFDLGQRLRTCEDLWDSNPEHGERETPRFFIAWAERKGIEVPWLAWARGEGLLPGESTAANDDAAAPPPTVRGYGLASVGLGPAPLTTDQVAVAFSGIGFTQKRWKETLGERPVWLADGHCQVAPGQQGQGGFQATWNPVAVASRFLPDAQGSRPHKKATIEAFNKAFRQHPALKPWASAWAARVKDIPGIE